MNDIMMQEHDNMPGMSELRVGDVVEGTVTELTNESIFLDVSYKIDARMPRSEIGKGEAIQRNDTIRVAVCEVDADREVLVVSRNKIIFEDEIQMLISCYESQQAVPGTISAVQSHGFSVSLSSQMSSFMPFSHSDLNKITNPGSYVGKELMVLITKIKKFRSSSHDAYDIAVSHREYLYNHSKQMREAFMKKFKVGDVVEGVVEDMFPNYARILVEGVSGTIVHGEASWLNNVTLKSVLKKHKTVRVRITAINDDATKVFLSIKALTEDPWLTIEDVLKPDSIVEGMVENVKDFGLFVRVAGIYQGLVHVSEVSWDNSDRDYKAGRTVKVRILAVDAKQRRLTLSIRQAEPSPWDLYCEQHADEVITATIKHAHTFGLICTLDKNIEGYLHQYQINWGNRVYNPAEFAVGEKIEVVVVGADNNHKRLRLSAKLCQDNPWDVLLDLKKDQAVVEVTISKKNEDGLIVSVGDGVEGFIHFSRIANFDHLSAKDLLQGFAIGDTIEARISLVDKQQRKIYLSTQEIEAVRNDKEMAKYLVSEDEHKTNITDLTNFS